MASLDVPDAQQAEAAAQHLGFDAPGLERLHERAVDVVKTVIREAPTT